MLDISKMLALWNKESKSNLKKATKSDCILWTGRGFGDKGFGVLVGGDVRILAHRAAYIAHHMVDISAGYRIAQSCNNKRCCNIAHLAEEYIGRV